MTNRQEVSPRPVQQRLSPKPGELHYLHVSDLLLAMRKAATSESVSVLDYGAGFSPYRSLFPYSKYLRVDIPSTPSVDGEGNETLSRDTAYPDPDYVILPDGRVPHESAMFDYVLSTQVLEHIREPETYLSEAFRLLRPGGKLLLSTHGTWFDHGCPYDFRRWTADGLKHELQSAGFDVLSVEKLTTGPRAILLLLQVYLGMESPPKTSLLGVWHRLCRFLPFRRLHVEADHLYPDCRIVSADTPGHDIYLCLFACAQRPR